MHLSLTTEPCGGGDQGIYIRVMLCSKVAKLKVSLSFQGGKRSMLAHFRRGWRGEVDDDDETPPSSVHA